MFENVKNYIAKLVKEKNLPYIDVSVYKNHSELFRCYNGTRNDITGKEELIMYSCSKPITSICMAKLIEKGIVSIDDEVSKYLPQFSKAYLIVNGQKVKPTTPMTIKHLLTMSAGFNYDFATKPLLELFDKTNDLCTSEEVINAIIEEPLLFNPGERFQYSLCYDVLGYLISVVSGKSLSQFAKDEIFDPLNMNRSTFSNKILKEEDCYPNYIAKEDGSIVPTNKFEREYISLPNYESGGAGLKSCVDDYAVFADALACGGIAKNGYRLIGEKTLNRFTTIEMDGVSIQKTFGCIQGSDYGYGYGFRVRKTDTDWGLQKGECGWDGACGSYVMIDKNKHISVVIGMNLENWPTVFTGEHLNIVKEIYKNIS